MSDQLALFRARTHAGTVLEIVPASNPDHLARTTDVGGSIAAAAEVVESGRADIEALVVLDAVGRYPGSTSAELAVKSAALGLSELGQTLTEWRHTCARRLPGLEDRDLVRAVAPRLSIRRPHRAVDSTIAPCSISELPSIRWWPKEVETP